MPRNDEGEFELVLGNKQLLSVFFVVVVLLGISAAMGYLIGRSAGAAAAMEQPRGRKIDPAPADPIVVDPTKGGAVAESPKPASAPSEPAAGAAKKPSPTPAPATATSEPPAAEPAAPAPPRADTPSPGKVYLQVSAVRRTEADVVADVLRSRGFKTLIAPSSKEGIFRVLVGPIDGKEAVAETKSALEKLNFKPIRQSF